MIEPPCPFKRPSAENPNIWCRSPHRRDQLKSIESWILTFQPWCLFWKCPQDSGQINLRIQHSAPNKCFSRNRSKEVWSEQVWKDVIWKPSPLFPNSLEVCRNQCKVWKWCVLDSTRWLWGQDWYCNELRRDLVGGREERPLNSVRTGNPRTETKFLLLRQV